MMNAPKVRQHCRTQAEREAAKKAMLASATATFETHVKKAAGGQLKAPRSLRPGQADCLCPGLATSRSHVR